MTISWPQTAKVPIPLYPVIACDIQMNEADFNKRTRASLLAVVEGAGTWEKSRFFKPFVMNPLPKNSREFIKTSHSFKNVSRVIEIYYFSVRIDEGELISGYIGKQSQIQDEKRRPASFTLAQKIVAVSLAISGDRLQIDLVRHARMNGFYGFEKDEKEAQYWERIERRLVRQDRSVSFKSICGNLRI